MYFGLYDTGAAKNPWKNDKGLMGMVSKFGIAQATAITAGYASYPFDTVRRRLQMQSEKPPSEWQYKGALDCLTKIIKEEGKCGTSCTRASDGLYLRVFLESFSTVLLRQACCVCAGGQSRRILRRRVELSLFVPLSTVK